MTARNEDSGGEGVEEPQEDETDESEGADGPPYSGLDEAVAARCGLWLEEG